MTACRCGSRSGSAEPGKRLDVEADDGVGRRGPPTVGGPLRLGRLSELRDDATRRCFGRDEE